MMRDLYDNLITQIHKVRRVRLPSVGLFASPLTVSYFFGIARKGIYKSRGVDVQQNIQAVVAPSFEARFEYMSQSGIYGSYLENIIIEQLFNYELGRVSATQVLMEANEQQIPIYAITSENIDTVLPLLAVSSEVKTDIVNAIHAGKHAIVPQREIVHGNWQGSGYIIQDSITGAGAYLLEGGLRGGALEGLSCEASKNPMVAAMKMVIQIMDLYFAIVAMMSFGSFAAAAMAIIAFQAMVKTLLKAVVKKQLKKKRAKKRKKKKRTECDCGTKKTRKGKRPEIFGVDMFSLRFKAKNLDNYLEIWRDELGKEPKLIDKRDSDEDKKKNRPVWETKNTPDENDKNRLGYVSGAQMKISEATFFITQKPKTWKQETVAITGNATTPQGKTFTFKDERAVVSENYVITKPILANRHLATRQTQFFNPMTIEWSVKYKKGGIPKTKVIGTSKHKVYVTFAKPFKDKPQSDYVNPENRLFLTLLHLATSNPGATTSKKAVEKSWALFKNPVGKNDITTWDGNRTLFYYPPGDSMAACLGMDLVEFLTNSDDSGQCGLFAQLFRETLWVNNIPAKLVEVTTLEEDTNMLVQNWRNKTTQFANNATDGYYWRLVLNNPQAMMVLTDQQEASDGSDGSKIYRDIDGNYVYGDLKSLPGIPGQNTSTPSQKAFEVHYMVKILLGEFANAPYYDPSYGKTFSGERDFENKAIFGYWKRFDDDENFPHHYRVRKPTGQTNIQFKALTF
jgi:hypothetical protein